MAESRFSMMKQINDFEWSSLLDLTGKGLHQFNAVDKNMNCSRLRDISVTNGQMGPAINAEYRRGQLAGFYVDRKEVVTASLDNMTRPELEAKLKEIRDHNVINGEAIGVEILELDDTRVQEKQQNKKSLTKIK